MNHLDLSPPYSVEAEQGVLGGLLLDNNTWDLVADKLDASDFSDTTIGCCSGQWQALLTSPFRSTSSPSTTRWRSQTKPEG